MRPEELLPQVYDELRRLASAKMRHEADGHTLDATALVHEVFIKLGGEASFATKSDFMRAAAEAMRRILVDHARSRKADKRGGDRVRVPLIDLPDAEADLDILALDEALSQLEQHDPIAAELVKLRYFSGLSHTEAAESLGLSRRQADGLWAVSRVWLFKKIKKK